jgi:hypothetical protein
MEVAYLTFFIHSDVPLTNPIVLIVSRQKIKFWIYVPCFLYFLFIWSIIVGCSRTVYRMKSATFWDITLCSPLKVTRRFGGTYRLHLQGQRMSQAKNQ